MIKKVAILTSGGDSPGMNAALRSFVRVAISNNVMAIGIEAGYDGLLNQNFIELNARSVGLIINQGGTFLKTSRSENFKTKKVCNRLPVFWSNRRLMLYVWWAVMDLLLV